MLALKKHIIQRQMDKYNAVFLPGSNKNVFFYQFRHLVSQKQQCEVVWVFLAFTVKPQYILKDR